MSEYSPFIRWPIHSVSRSAGVFITLLIASTACTQENAEPKRDPAKTEAVILWTGMAIGSILVLGIGLIWGVTRAAKRIRQKHEPVHTEMPNIWYLNPPEKRKQDEP